MIPSLWRWFWPLGPPALAAMAIVHLGIAPHIPSGLVAGLQLISCLAAFLVAWRYSRTRILYALALLLLAQHFAGRWIGSTSNLGSDIFLAVSILLPVNFALVSLYRERGLFNWIGLARLAFILAQLPLANHALISWYPESSEWIRRPWIGPLPASLLGQPQTAAFAMGLGLLVCLARSLHRPTAIESALFWSLALAASALLAWPSPQAIPVLFSAAHLILASGVFTSFKRPGHVDELTDLPGQLALEECLARLSPPYTIAAADLDHFQKFNDAHGWDVGNQALRMIATQLGAHGLGAKAFRCDGDRFALIFPNQAGPDVLDTLHQLHARIAARPFYLRGWFRPKRKPASPRHPRKPQTLSVTISMGICSQPGEGNPQEALAKAFVAAQSAKRAGRNQVRTC